MLNKPKSTIPWLDAGNLNFPDTAMAMNEPNGLLAVGGDLSSERLIAAYRSGIFPWYEAPQPILWWSPSPRAVLFPAKVVVSRSLGKRLRKSEYTVSCDLAFLDVIKQCSKTPRKDQEGTWIGDAMVSAYCRLHKMNIAHSLEVWHQGKLVGGLYGLAIGKVFFGESMFSHHRDASKIAFVHLAKQLETWQFALIDCQVSNPHLFSLGAEAIKREQFTQLLAANIDKVGPAQWPVHWTLY
ncbi:MAG: leucyl/phenylalanyl-tRNA--protein transferase [Pseudomonadales bacterium]